VNGGIGPAEAELGVEAPDEPGDEAGVFRRDDFAITEFVCLLGIVFVPKRNVWSCCAARDS
jgi:hypothetical protein